MTHNNRVFPKVLDPNDLPEGLPPSYESHLGDHLPAFQRHITSKFCYHAGALKDAQVVAVDKKFAYQIDLWTLMERRWVVWKTKPYQDEPIPSRSVGHLFNDHEFDLPPTVIEGKQTATRDLPDCQKADECDTCKGVGNYHCSTCVGKGRCNCIRCFHQGYHSNGSICKTCHGTGTVRCSACQGRGTKNCDRCGTKGKILTWPTINVEWNTVHSVDFAQNTFLPLKRIEKAGGKQNFYNDDKTWHKSQNLSNYSDLYSQISHKSPVQFQGVINEQYVNNHLNKMRDDMNIAKLKCKIDRIEIQEIDYKASGYVNKTEDAPKGDHIFTFLQYGPDEKGLPRFFERDYPLNSCGCFGEKCATRSGTCTVL